MRRKLYITRYISIVLCLGFLMTPLAAHARPVSYPGGWTVMFMNDPDTNSSHIHYTFTPKFSLGWRHEYMRQDSIHVDSTQANILLRRWNAPKSQANIYLKSGAGVAYGNDETGAAAYTGLAADWEDRRFFTSYENRLFWADGIDRFTEHKARIGAAPYVGDYGDLHTWIMLQADYNPDAADDFSLTPLVRFFKGPAMLEAGYNLDRGILLNGIYRF